LYKVPPSVIYQLKPGCKIVIPAGLPDGHHPGRAGRQRLGIEKEIFAVLSFLFEDSEPD